MGYKKLQDVSYLKSQSLPRDYFEKDLTFLGLLIMNNQLKPVSADVIAELNKYNIRTIMATGDNILTAISVAKSCNIISPNAPVYIGELVQDSKDHTQEKLVWRKD
jgi:cation-transporting ATPase 13A3/4/5